MIFQKCKSLLKDNLRGLQYFEPENKFSQLVGPFIKLKASLLFITLLNIERATTNTTQKDPHKTNIKIKHRASFTKFSLEQSSGGFS